MVRQVMFLWKVASQRESAVRAGRVHFELDPGQARQEA